GPARPSGKRLSDRTPGLQGSLEPSLLQRGSALHDQRLRRGKRGSFDRRWGVRLAGTAHLEPPPCVRRQRDGRAAGAGDVQAVTEKLSTDVGGAEERALAFGGGVAAFVFAASGYAVVIVRVERRASRAAICRRRAAMNTDAYRGAADHCADVLRARKC